MQTAKKVPIQGWRTMTGAQRRNAQYDRIWEGAKDAKTRFNESSRTEPLNGFDYENQAWVVDGKYVSCGHPESMNCGCYGRIHAGESPAANAEIH